MGNGGKPCSACSIRDIRVIRGFFVVESGFVAAVSTKNAVFRDAALTDAALTLTLSQRERGPDLSRFSDSLQDKQP